jgi:hypothetical protein
MAQEIYHRSEWGNPNEQWGNIYLNADLTNELYKRASEYENSWVTDQLLNGVGTKPSIVLTPTAYEDGVLNSVKPPKTFGSELIPNGTFKENVNGWITNNDNASFVWQIDQTALFTSTSFAYAKLNPTLNLTSGTYKVAFDILSFTGTLSNVHIGLGTSGNTVTTTGSFSYNYVSSGGSTEFQIRPNSGGTGSIKIDNISVKKITDADFDFTRGSSATRVNELGLVQDVTDTDLPRINYTNFDYENGEVVPYSGEGSLLLENQSTNLVTYSEDYSQSDWSKTNISITTNSAISPNGTINASLLTENSSNAQHFIGDALTLTSGTSYSVSVYAKKKERSVLQISPSSSHIASSYANYDLDLGVVSATGGSVTAEIEYLSNDWYRCILKFTVTSTATATLAFFMQTSTTATRGASYQGDGTSGLYLWGAQVEAISYATSYISTNGSTVTRLADVCNNAGSSDLINSTEGVLYAEIAALSENYTGRRFITLNDSTSSNGVVLRYEASGVIVARYQISGIAQCSIAFAATITNYHKIAFKYSLNDFALWVDGVEVGVDSSGNVLSDSVLNNIDFNSGNGTFPFYGNVKCLAVFKEALSDTELEKLTTI